MSLYTGQWYRIAQSERLCRSSQAVAVVGKKVCIFGGEFEPRKPVDNQVYILNAEEVADVQTIPASENAPSPRVGSPSTAINGNVYLFSGRGGPNMRPIEEDGAVWRYNVDGAEWTLIKPSDAAAKYPAGRSYHCITSDYRENIFVHSGCPESGRLSDLWVFNTHARRWSELPAAPGSARGGASIAYAHEKVYRINGFDGKSEQGGALDVFDIATKSWSTVTYTADGENGPEARSVATLLPVSVRARTWLITMFGERDPSSLGHAGAGKMLSDIWAWDIKHAMWSKVAPTGDTPEPRGWFDADVLGDEAESLLVHGGLNEENQRLGDIWKLSFR